MAEPSRTRRRRTSIKLASVAVLALAGGIGAAAAAETTTLRLHSALAERVQASPAPKEPMLCRAPASANGVRKQGTVEYRDALCGSRGRDFFETRGGGDAVWAYQGNDTIDSRDLKPDEVWGGPGRDTADTDPCDEVHGVEKRTQGGACPGVDASPVRRLQASDELPYFPPVVECWTAPDGSRRIDYLWEPEIRALDVTPNVDFQTVAWQTVVLKQVEGDWAVYLEGSWFWDRTYDLQVKAFAGNYWRSFETGRRTFVGYRIDEPGTYAVGVIMHWYKTAKAPQREDVAVARAHYGPNEQLGHGACEFNV
jgi:hypothetical protein